MQLTSFTSPARKPYLKNNAFKILSLLFVIAWVIFFKTAKDATDWWLENILVFIFLIGLFAAQRKFIFSDISLLFIFSFLLLHIYGAKMAYTLNEVGEFLRNSFHLVRNPYDRIVHFSFGFLMAYPFADLLYNKFRVMGFGLVMITNMAILCLATIFELIEWGVAAFTDKVTGETYVATQGDPWDAQKDIILALVGSVLFITITRTFNKSFESKNAVS